MPRPRPPSSQPIIIQYSTHHKVMQTTHSNSPVYIFNTFIFICLKYDIRKEEHKCSLQANKKKSGLIDFVFDDVTSSVSHWTMCGSYKQI